MQESNSHVSKSAIIHPSVKIGPFCYIGENVKIDKIVNSNLMFQY